MFDLNNGIFRFLNKIFDLVVLNLLFLLTCLPIFTIGPSLTALYSILLKYIDGREGYLAKGYLKAFKQNFKQAAIVWLGFFIIAAVLLTDLKFYSMSHSAIVGTLLLLISIIGLFLLLVTLEYALPLLAFFENSVVDTVKNAALLGMVNLWNTIAVIGINILAFGMTLLSLDKISFWIPFWGFIGCSGTVYLKAYMFRRIFKSYIP